MEKCETLNEKNPRNVANYFSKLFFCWMREICINSNIGNLKLKDIYKNQENDDSTRLAIRLEKLWDEEIKYAAKMTRSPSLFKIIMKGFASEYALVAVLVFIHVIVLRSAQPIIFAGLLRCFDGESYDFEQSLYYGAGLSLITFFSVITDHHLRCESNLIGMRIRISVSSLIYRKMLKLSQLSLSQTDVGQVTNLLSNDVARFDAVMPVFNYLWVTPIQVCIVAYLMWMHMDPTSTIGIFAVIVLTLPVHFFLGNLTSKYRKEIAKRTDYRIQVISEFLSGVQLIKMCVWEKPFEYLVTQARLQELNILTKTNFVRGVVSSLNGLVGRAALGAVLITYGITNHSIKADSVFSLWIYFLMLQVSLGVMFPIGVTFGAETLVSIGRLQNFLIMEEKKSSAVHASSGTGVILKNVSASWIADSPTLKNLNIEIPPGILCAVIGSVGSGKSSFLKLLLGELESSPGRVELSGSLSYASQEPWLFAASVKENIIFGQKYNAERYRNVIEACALQKDVDQFVQGDEEIVSSGGSSLSGGQRVRINLARAVYQNSDVYLLDDPLSAVDCDVGKHIFNQCIMDYLKDKTRILVTHQLQYLKEVQLIIVLKRGSIVALGTFEELSQREDLDLIRILKVEDETNVNYHTETSHKRQPKISTMSNASLIDKPAANKGKGYEEIVTHRGSSLLSYMKYCRNSFLTTILVISFILSQIFLSGMDYWLSFWSDQEATRDLYKISLNSTSAQLTWFDEVTINDETHRVLKKPLLLHIFVLIISFAIVITLLRSFLFFYGCIRSSKYIHNDMFHCLVEAPMNFFYSNPPGRILNRLSRDIGYIDEQLPKPLIDACMISLEFLGIAVMVVIITPYTLIYLVILVLLCFKMTLSLTRTIRSIKHIEAVTKSPVFSHIASSINGVTTIRSAKLEGILIEQFDALQNVHTSVWYLLVNCSECFGLWFDLACAVFVTYTVIGMCILNNYIPVRNSFLGLAVLQSLKLTGMLPYCMQQFSQISNDLTCVERVLEYTKLGSEKQFQASEGIKPMKPWPSKGKITFRNVFLKYNLDHPPIVKNLRLEVRPAEKIGIVGRTGAGKTSIIAALFRLAILEGEILIDDVDINTLDLKYLRRKISVIPQHPILFSATVRYNLDPSNKYTDDEIWKVLEQVELKRKVNSLDFMVTQGGSNFSVGEKQLICLGRALLRKNIILVLDESTSNMDPETDAIIQKIIRKKFKKCTVLTIAHNLNTIMESDRVLVMDNGCKVEFDHPHVLLQNTNGFFANMVKDCGSVNRNTANT